MDANAQAFFAKFLKEPSKETGIAVSHLKILSLERVSIKYVPGTWYIYSTYNFHCPSNKKRSARNYL